MNGEYKTIWQEYEEQCLELRKYGIFAIPTDSTNISWGCPYCKIDTNGKHRYGCPFYNYSS
jgi:hypothetical protein